MIFIVMSGVIDFKSAENEPGGESFFLNLVLKQRILPVLHRQPWLLFYVPWQPVY